MMQEILEKWIEGYLCRFNEKTQKWEKVDLLIPKELSEKCDCPLKPEHVKAEHDWCCQICGGSHVERICPERKIIVSPEDLKAIRLQVAYSICAKHKSVYRKLFSNKGYVMNENEKVASEVLEELCKLEPSFKPILETYFK